MPNTEEGTRHYSKAVLHGLPACQIGSINRVLLTAARLAGRIPKFCKVTEYIRDELHWLPYLHRITYRISASVRRCIEGLSPPYLRELCCFTAHVQRRCYLCSAAQAELIVPCSRTTTRQHFLLLALRPGMGFLPLFYRYLWITPPPSPLPSRLLCLTVAGLGVLLRSQS